jgi:hypothetical protein
MRSNTSIKRTAEKHRRRLPWRYASSAILAIRRIPSRSISGVALSHSDFSPEIIRSAFSILFNLCTISQFSMLHGSPLQQQGLLLHS